MKQRTLDDWIHLFRDSQGTRTSAMLAKYVLTLEQRLAEKEATPNEHQTGDRDT